MAVTIGEFKTREILDSRGQPTLEVSCSTNHGQRVVAKRWNCAMATPSVSLVAELSRLIRKKDCGKRLREALAGPTTGSG
ncbi:MAG TPA: hypothetical protein VFS89_07100 [Nitrosospira sp.]|nr:hypothetical protein [Nitrosospira sp.]